MTRKSPISGEKETFRFKRKEHLKGRNEIRKVFDEGKHYYCRGAKLFILKNELPFNRICFTFSGGIGNAVVRNRAKRLGREAFRLIKHRICGNYDVILLVYPEKLHREPPGNNLNVLPTGKVKLSDRVRQLEVLFSKAGILSKTGAKAITNNNGNKNEEDNIRFN